MSVILRSNHYNYSVIVEVKDVVIVAYIKKYCINNQWNISIVSFNLLLLCENCQIVFDKVFYPVRFCLRSSYGVNIAILLKVFNLQDIKLYNVKELSIQLFLFPLKIAKQIK
ncbi:hypothetical protein WA026_013745 [Henosepilachna vigintioctopunctata]|uniref:Uncharacterized protein n=1 Tax=Henosepilachna vigintioctopunctata TaxID=420089 RepID=A0AAW1UXL8_9CUCU